MEIVIHAKDKTLISMPEDTVNYCWGYYDGWNEAIDRACDLIEQQVGEIYGISEEVSKLKKE